MAEQRVANRTARERKRIDELHAKDLELPFLDEFNSKDLQGGSKAVQEGRKRWGQRFDSFRESKGME